jgi:hypothetical protein
LHTRIQLEVHVVTRSRVGGIASILALFAASGLSARMPHGSLTIDRIAQIKTPSSAAWSPDGS